MNLKKREAKLKTRQKDYDEMVKGLSFQQVKGYRRPGSLKK